MSSNPTKNSSPNSFNQKLDRHFLACSALVGVAALAGTQNADATIVYSGVQNLIVPTTNGAGGIYIDLEIGPGSTGNFIPNGSGGGSGTATGWDINPYRSGSGRLRLYTDSAVQGSSIVTNLANGAFVALLSGGVTIDGGQLFSNQAAMVNTAGTGPWVNTTGFIGIQFNTSTATGIYGWVRVNAGNTLGLPATVVDWAYEDSGAAIVTGAVPEPGSLALGCLAAGAAGLTLWRKRKKA